MNRMELEIELKQKSNRIECNRIELEIGLKQKQNGMELNGGHFTAYGSEVRHPTAYGSGMGGTAPNGAVRGVRQRRPLRGLPEQE